MVRVAAWPTSEDPSDICKCFSGTVDVNVSRGIYILVSYAVTTSRLVILPEGTSVDREDVTYNTT